jgi:hypothetical protein
MKLYELGRLSTGKAAILAGMEWVELLFAVRRPVLGTERPLLVG